MDRKKGHRLGICNSCHTIRSKKKTKLKAIIYKGGECEECGYRKSMAALCFHHKDPRTKLFGVGTKGYTYSFKRIKKEIDKCRLLCHNCHSEIHEKLDSKKSILQELMKEILKETN